MSDWRDVDHIYCISQISVCMYAVAPREDPVEAAQEQDVAWGHAQGDPMHPEWGQEFEFYDVRDDAKAVIDVWNKQVGGEADQFLGKALRRLHTVATACTVGTASADHSHGLLLTAAGLGRPAAQRGMPLRSPLRAPS